MVIQKEANKKKIVLGNITFNAEEMYKECRKQADALKYGFVEAEHEAKQEKYGYFRKYKFVLPKNFDDFARGEIIIELKFENLSRVKLDGKELDRGDANVDITANVFLDKKNEWNMSIFYRKLFSFYDRYFMRDTFKKLYFKPLGEDTEKIYEALKAKLEYYH